MWACNVHLLEVSLALVCSTRYVPVDYVFWYGNLLGLLEDIPEAGVASDVSPSCFDSLDYQLANFPIQLRLPGILAILHACKCASWNASTAGLGYACK